MLEHNKNYNFFIPSSFLLNRSKILEQLPEGSIIVLNEVDSTNQYIIDNIRYLKSGDACVAEHQTQGRGRRGNTWITSFGQSVCLSIYWKADRILPSIAAFSVMISVVVAKMLRNLGVSQIQIKWPNDLYIHGRKLAGILIEVVTGVDKMAHVIIGIGINVSMCTCSALETKMSKNWISLKDVGVTIDRNVLVVVLINILRRELKNFLFFGFMPFIFLLEKFCLFVY